MTARQSDLRVMSFNIQKERGGSRAGRWAGRKEPVLLAIRAFDPDLLGAQEVQPRQVAHLREELSEYGFASAGRNQRVFAGESTAIFYRTERFERLDAGHFWLSKAPDRPGSRHWHSVVPRVVCWVQLRDRLRRGRRLFLFNAHFCPVSWGARMQSVWLLRQRIVRLAGRLPAVVTGDFNTQAGGKAYTTLRDGMHDGGLELIDAYRAVHPDPEPYEGTWHGPSGRRGRRRID